MTPLDARKRWIAGQLKVKGEVALDPGAVAALQRKGVSLLPVGVVTDLGVLRPAESGELVLHERHPGVTTAEIKAETDWALLIVEDLSVSEPPGVKELVALRELDPQRNYLK